MKDIIAVVVDTGVEWIRDHSQYKMESSLCGGQIWNGGLPSPRLLLSLLLICVFLLVAHKLRIMEGAVSSQGQCVVRREWKTWDLA